MEVLVFTADEPLYLPEYLDPVLADHAEHVQEVVVAPPPTPVHEQVRDYYRTFGPVDFLRMGALFARGYVLDALPADLGRRLTGRRHSVPAVVQDHGVPVTEVPDVNHPAFVARVRDRDPDLIVSLVCGQKLGSELLSIPDRAVNCHGSLLPKYRGRATAFWPLYYGDDRTGVTAHLMTDEFDAGPILAQRSFPIAEDDTLHSLYLQLADVGASLAVDLVEAWPDWPDPRPNPTSEADYHGLPTAAECREFRRRGNEFL